MKELLLCHLISVFASAVFAKNLWGSWLRITVLISSFSVLLGEARIDKSGMICVLLLPKKNSLRYLVRHMELWSANIWLKHSSTNYAVSFLYLTHKKLIWRETSLIQSGKSSILPNHSPRINALAKTVPLHLQTHVETCSPAGIWLVTVTQTSALFLTSVAWKSFRHSHYLSQQQHENFFYSLFSLMVFTASVSEEFGKTHPNFTLYLLEKLC